MMFKPFDNLKITIERHELNELGGKITKVKKVYIVETFKEPREPSALNEYFKAGLKAKKILKYLRDECSFRWVVWYL